MKLQHIKEIAALLDMRKALLTEARVMLQSGVLTVATELDGNAGLNLPGSTLNLPGSTLVLMAIRDERSVKSDLFQELWRVLRAHYQAQLQSIDVRLVELGVEFQRSDLPTHCCWAEADWKVET